MLPQLLADLRTACNAHEGDTRLKAEALSAEAHHVAASVLLKLDDEGLAWIAADRSMQAARNSQDPTILASSARIITHALMNDGRHGAATTTAGSGRWWPATPAPVMVRQVPGDGVRPGVQAPLGHLFTDADDQPFTRL